MADSSGMNVFGYLRVSSRGQIDGDGFPRQEKAIKSFCETNRLRHCGEFKEEGVSGTVEAIDRPQFLEMVEYIQKRQDCPASNVEAIVVERMDRLARDLMVQEFLLAECRKRGIKVFSTDQGALIDMASDGGDPTRKLIRHILGALAEWEKSSLVLKLRAARQRVKAKTGRCEGGLPYGATAVEGRILQFALATFDTIKNYGTVAKMLNDGGFTTKQGSAWTRQNLRPIIVGHYKRVGYK